MPLAPGLPPPSWSRFTAKQSTNQNNMPKKKGVEEEPSALEILQAEEEEKQRVREIELERATKVEKERERVESRKTKSSQ